MKWVVLLILSILMSTVMASATKAELVNNLSDSGSYSWDWPFFTGGGAYVYWIAFDYDPDDTYLVDQVKFDWVYGNNTSCRGDMNFEIYLEDFDDPPLFSFTVQEEDYIESDTGYGYAGRDVYRGDIPLGSGAFGVTPDSEYWIALQVDTPEASDRVHAVGWGNIVGDRPWYHDTFGWHHHPLTDECSYALYGEVTGVESASLGEIKALFK